MVSAWRISKSRYASIAFDGEGARLNGGRWNSVGVRVAYASQSVALAALEVLVGLQKSAALASYSLIGIQFDERWVETVPLAALPANWRGHPAPPETQAIGDRWILERRSLVLKVPSAIVELESNYLINPAHPEAARLVVSPPAPFELDARLLAAVRSS